MLALYALLVASLFASPRGNPGFRPLADYLERAALTWMELPDCSVERVRCDAFERQEREPPSAVATRIGHVASDVAAVLQEGFAGNREPSPYVDDPAKARAGLLVMSIAFHESRFRGYVASGACDIPALGTCDGGRASTIWQMHIGRGLYMGWEGRDWGGERSAPGDVLVTRDLALGNGAVAAALALHMARASIRSTGTLRYYTGEWEGLAPKASAREGLAAAYYRAHPYGGIVTAEETTP